MKKTSIGHYVLAYLLWLITLALNIVVSLVIIESSVELMSAAEWHRYPIHAVRQFMTFFLGLIVLVLLVWNEHHYRTGAERNRLLERFAWMVGISLIAMGIFHGIAGIVRFYTMISIGMTPSWVQLVVAAVELVGGFVCLWYAKRAKNESKLARQRVS